MIHQKTQTKLLTDMQTNYDRDLSFNNVLLFMCVRVYSKLMHSSFL